MEIFASFLTGGMSKPVFLKKKKNFKMSMGTRYQLQTNECMLVCKLYVVFSRENMWKAMQ